MIDRLASGNRLFDRRTGRERVLHAVEVHGSVVFLSFRLPNSGAVDRQPFSRAEVDERFEVVSSGNSAFAADPEIVSLVAEAYRLRHAYLFNHLFATETSLIDLLPHQLAAVYGIPASDERPTGQPGMLDLPRLRFLLADDAGAGKTIMAGLLIREMLLRRLAQRVLVVSPAGLVGNWRRELGNLFRLSFRILGRTDFMGEGNPFTDAGNRLAIISLDTLWRERARTAYLRAAPYDLVIFDEAHKLAAWREADMTVQRTQRYQVAEAIAAQGRHLLLMTATPHMGKDDPYYYLWRLLDPALFSTPEAFARASREQKQRYLLRRMKEEMVRFDGTPIFPSRDSNTISYPLGQGVGSEQDLYDQATTYCQTHYDRARNRNRSAAGLAMSILQRRLASSTWALLKSLERRVEKLAQAYAAVSAGTASLDDLAEARVDAAQDLRDTATADEEEAEGGLEAGERQDEQMSGATDARTLVELRAEWDEVRRLAGLARRVYDQKHESKFERLWEALEQYSDTKALIFTEFRDTLDFLVGRLEGKGLTGRVAHIHGGMDYRERERQAAFFAQPDGARIMVATDAAGEGINLQFCWLLVNYDIPWNPARLEQRMGRVHRYKQRHDVLLFNLVSLDTREGRVLKVLLDKLESIRRELGSDKVFDIIGTQFTGKPLAEIIFEAVVEGREQQARDEFERTLDPEQVRERLAAQARRVEISDVRATLSALQAEREAAELRRMMPAYVRRFFSRAVSWIGAGIQGDINGSFGLDPCPPGVAQALAGYPEAIRDKLTFDRSRAMPDLARDPQAVYLHPGEAVFDAIADQFLGEHEAQAERGAIFLDSDTSQPYVFYLAKTAVLRDPPAEAAGEAPEVVSEAMSGVRCYCDGRCEPSPAHLLLSLFPAQPADMAEVPAADLPAELVAEAFVVERLGQPALQGRRQAEEAALPERQTQLRTAYNLRLAELYRQRRLLKEAVENGVPAAGSKLRECEAELSALDRTRRAAEADLLAAIDRLRLAPVSIYARALVLPTLREEAERRRLAESEAIALAEVRRREEAQGSIVEDFSDPHLGAGFDYKVLRADGELRYVEVKGRAGRPAVELTANEWAQAANHRDRYWLYAVYDCDTVPRLYQVPDPFGRLLARQTGAVRINAADVMGAAD